ncbi:MAG: hypothetical protein HFG66_10270 [Hungatella sp.]|nr:hypothetical protein [Hungatella sp.]
MVSNSGRLLSVSQFVAVLRAVPMMRASSDWFIPLWLRYFWMTAPKDSSGPLCLCGRCTIDVLDVAGALDVLPDASDGFEELPRLISSF